MERRQFLWICGFTGLGAMIGLHPAETSLAAHRGRYQSTLYRKSVWMSGSAKTGCARLPNAEPFDIEAELPAVFPVL